MLALHLLQLALVHINILLLQAVLEVPEFHDSIGGAERRALTPVVLESQQTRTTGSAWTWTPALTWPHRRQNLS